MMNDDGLLLALTGSVLHARFQMQFSNCRTYNMVRYHFC